jgi:SAM-dependent methyltransferase
MVTSNLNQKVIKDFGDEWNHYRQDAVPSGEFEVEFENYFNIIDLESLKDSVAADVGCGSGRWAKFMQSRVKHLYCIEPSSALAVAREKLSGVENVTFINTDIDTMPLKDNSLDFAYCLGVLHHLPDPFSGILRIAEKIKPGGQFLAYIYYRFDTQPFWFKALWRISDIVRRLFCRLPHRIKVPLSVLIAVAIYWPLARSARLIEKAGFDVHDFPLSHYRDKSLYTMKTDALDRFGTSLEHRFTRVEIETMLSKAGFHEIVFSVRKPQWCVRARKL